MQLAEAGEEKATPKIHSKANISMEVNESTACS